MECDYLNKQIKLSRKEAKMLFFYINEDPKTAFANKLKSVLYVRGHSDCKEFEGIFPGEPSTELWNLDFCHHFRLFYSNARTMESDAKKLDLFFQKGFMKLALRYVRDEFGI